MERESLKNGLLKLYQYFRLSNLPDTDQIDLWHLDLRYIPDSALDSIFAILKNNDSIPRNIPKAFKRAYGATAKSVILHYDRDEDPRFPIQHLWTGLEMLENQGEAAFYYFCDAVKMPLNDRERVKNKFNCMYDVGVLTKNLSKNIPETPETYQCPRPVFPE